MDECDRASNIASFMDRVFLNARVILKPSEDAVSYIHCEECGEKIPEARRIAEPGCTLCVDCKASMEGYGGKHAR